MVHCCSVYICTNATDKNPELSFHSFPNEKTNKGIRDKWIAAVKRKYWSPTKYSKICSAHFLAGDYYQPKPNAKLLLKKDAVPSVFDCPNHLQPKKGCPVVVVPFEVESSEPDVIIEEVFVVSTVDKEEEPAHNSVAVQTDLTGIELTNILTNLRRDKKLLQQQLHRRN